MYYHYPTHSEFLKNLAINVVLLTEESSVSYPDEYLMYIIIPVPFVVPFLIIHYLLYHQSSTCTDQLIQS